MTNAALRILKDEVIFLVISSLLLFQGAALAQEPVTRFFTEPLILSRGKIIPTSPTAKVVSRSAFCELVTKEWGWKSCDGIEAFIIEPTPMLDSEVVLRPNSEGYVSLDDWKSGDLSDAIKSIEAELRESLKQQGERIGANIEFVGWHVYPTLDEKQHTMFYATDVKWNGEITTNIKAVRFDRQGYVTFLIVPNNSNMTKNEIEQSIKSVLANYTPAADQFYSDYRTGDKVAAAGAVGVLATLLGVKYGKGAFAAAVAIALAFAKKAWFLLLLPFLAIGRLFKRKSD